MKLITILPCVALGAFTHMGSNCGIEQMQGMFAACPGGDNFNLQSPSEVAQIDFTCWDTHVDGIEQNAGHTHRRRRSFDELIRQPRSTGTCPFANGMTGHGCPNRMTKSNGSCKTGTIARCVQCSGCDYYKVDKANEQARLASRSYLRNNPHCERCRKLGKRTAIRKNTDFSGALWSCLQKPSVPAKCLSFTKCNRINYDADERRTCTKFYNTRKLYTSEIQVNNLPLLPAMLDEVEMSGVTINNVYDTIVMVVNVQVVDNDSSAAARWSQLRQIVKTAIYQFDQSMLSNFFVIFEGRDNLAKIYGSHSQCDDLANMYEAMGIVNEEMERNGGVSFDTWDSLMKEDSQWGNSFMGILEYLGNLLNKGDKVQVAGNVAVVHYQIASDATPTLSMTKRAITYFRRFKDAHPEITNIRIAFNYMDQAAPHKHDLRQVINSMGDVDMSESTFQSFGRTVYAGGVIDNDILVMGYSTTPAENMVNFFEIQRAFFDNWGPQPTRAPTTQPPVTVINDRHICESNNPCQNGCTCQPSCRDHMDYVCEPQPGFPFVGKNCEWPVVAKCLAGNTIHVDIPEAAIDAYELSVDNGILHGCNRADFMCDDDTRTCGPVKTADFTGKYSLDCTTSSMQSMNGVFTFSQTFVLDRDSALIHMPIPIVTVACQMSTGSTQALLDPQMRPPQTKDYSLMWTPRVRFYKTPFDVFGGIEANNGNVINNNGAPEVAYVVGEKIHVRVTGVLDNIVPSGSFQVRVDTCYINQVNENGNTVSGSTVNLITNGMANSAQVPVGIEQNPGYLNSINGQNPGAGFWFQMFTFRAGSKLQMYCTATFSPVSNGRKKRSTDDNESHEFTLTFRVLDDGELNQKDPDVPVITAIQENEDEDEIDARSIPLLAQALGNDSEISEIEAEIQIETTFLLKVLLLTTFICLAMLVAYQIVAHRRASATVYTTEEKLMLQ